jgi:hypothetical protein
MATINYFGVLSGNAEQSRAVDLHGDPYEPPTLEEFTPLTLNVSAADLNAIFTRVSENTFEWDFSVANISNVLVVADTSVNADVVAFEYTDIFDRDAIRTQDITSTTIDSFNTILGQLTTNANAVAYNNEMYNNLVNSNVWGTTNPSLGVGDSLNFGVAFSLSQTANYTVSGASASAPFQYFNPTTNVQYVGESVSSTFNSTLNYKLNFVVS